MAAATIPHPLLRSYMPELDVLRGIAVLMVLFLHGMAPPLQGHLSIFGRALFAFSQYGGAGVNVFFVLSGFLITGILLDSAHRPDYYRRFYLRRVLRILPAFYAALIILLLARWIGWRFFGASILFLANFAPLFGQSLQYPVLWSLAVEEHFYMLWPAVIQKGSWVAHIIVVSFLCVAAIAARAITFYVTRNLMSMAFFYTWCNLDGLALGAAVAIWLRSPDFRRAHLAMIAAPLLIVFTIGFVVLAAHPGLIQLSFENFCRDLASCGLLGCMLLMGTNQVSFLVNQSFLKFLGFISYGLYLIHEIVFRLTEVLFSRAFGWLITAEMPTAAMLLRFLLGAVLSIGVAYLSRVWFEEKFMQMGRAPDPTLHGAAGSAAAVNLK